MNMFQKSHALIQLIPYYHPLSLSVHIYIYINVYIYIYVCEKKHDPYLTYYDVLHIYIYDVYIYT